MAGNTNFPTALDDDSSLYDVTDAVSTLQAAHHNNLKEGLKAVQQKVGIFSTASPTTLDYRLGNATAGHRHDGASGQGPQINATAVVGLASAGVLPYSGAKRLVGATFAIAHGAWTPVPTWATSEWDTHSYYSSATSGYVVPTNGHYDVGLSAMFPASPSGWRGIAITRGPTYIAQHGVPASTTAPRISLSTEIVATVGDLIRGLIYQDSGATAVFLNHEITNLRIRRVR